jgi:hypothetical protein
MKMIKIFLWEFAQNVGPVTGFSLAVSFWQSNFPWAAFLSAFIGGGIGALMIAATESRKVEGHREPVAVIFANITGMTILSCGMAIYFTTLWSTWWTDLFIGIFVGVLLGVVQSLAAKEPIGIRHCVALGISCPVILILLRELFMVELPILVNIAVITTLMTLIIVLIDYLPLKKDITT